MKIILIFVSTLDGKVTKWGEPHVSSWSSHQDQDYYKNVLNESRLIAMGGNTFNADTFKPSANHKPITMTATMINIKTWKLQDIVNLQANLLLT